MNEDRKQSKRGAVIETTDLTKTYGKARGITNVNLSVAEGEIYGFVGPNGAGKSTTIKLLLNLIYPTSGSAKLLGMDCVTDAAKIKEQIGYVPSEVRFYPYLTGEELIKITLGFHGSKTLGAMDSLCSRLDIDKKKKIGELSLGNKKKIAIACALIHEPRLIILDEPTSGLDPLIQKRLFELLKERNQKGSTIFVSSHNLNEVQEHCSKVAFIKEGRILKIQDLKEAQGQKGLTKIVSLKAKGIRKEALVALGARELQLDTVNGLESARFSYQGDMGRLVEALAAIKPVDLTVENHSLEDEFLNYYEGGLQ